MAKRTPKTQYELEQRLRDIREANAIADPPCPGCGCTKAKRCFLDLGDGQSSACGRVPGHVQCSGCVNKQARGAAE